MISNIKQQFCKSVYGWAFVKWYFNWASPCFRRQVKSQSDLVAVAYVFQMLISSLSNSINTLATRYLEKEMLGI